MHIIFECDVPWGNLAVFYRDHGGAAAGLVYLGEIRASAEEIKNLNGQVRIHAETPRQE